jgi:hypothetical protein
LTMSTMCTIPPHPRRHVSMPSGRPSGPEKKRELRSAGFDAVVLTPAATWFGAAGWEGGRGGGDGGGKCPRVACCVSERGSSNVC